MRGSAAEYKDSVTLSRSSMHIKKPRADLPQGTSKYSLHHSQRCYEDQAVKLSETKDTLQL